MNLTPGAQAVVAILTAITLGLMGWGLKHIASTYGAGWLWVTVAGIFVIGLPVAFRLEALDKRDRERSSRQQSPPSEH